MNAEKTQTSGAGPLAGIVVVGLGRALAGPHAAMMLADLGARVIKVEAPGSGDDTRGWGPPFVDPESSRESTYFLSCNRNKESVVLDLKEAGDHAMLRAMLERADVLVENFRTGVMDRLGLDTGRLLQLNPRLVVLSLTGFGRDGPEGGRPGYDQIVQGEAGLMSLTGPGKPQKAGVPIADLLAGVYGALGVVAAVRVLEAPQAVHRATWSDGQIEGWVRDTGTGAWYARFRDPTGLVSLVLGNDVRPVKSGS
jgi:crotonobetainyl-CoA:carnitine CoA-transferase CaiB-like acyl-CoA transferase